MKILFMCVANSARSQIAEGIAKHIFPNFDIESAGSNPGKLNQFAVQVMKEIWIDIKDHWSKSCDDLPPEFLLNLDYVITLCAEEVCPVIPTKAKRIHWPFPDPVSRESISDAESLKRFRETREQIQRKLFQFQEQLANDTLSKR